MENGNSTEIEWTAERGYATRGGDRVTLMERGEGGPRAIMWSYASQWVPHFTEYADRSEALATFMRSYIHADDQLSIVGRRAPGW